MKKQAKKEHTFDPERRVFIDFLLLLKTTKEIYKNS
jgi:hypothetical protein